MFYCVCVCVCVCVCRDGEMADTTKWLSGLVVLALSTWLAAGLWRYVDGYFRDQFLAYVQLEMQRNPHMSRDLGSV